MSSANSYEMVSFAFKPEVPFEQQKQSAESLNVIVKKLNGFQSRQYFYNEEAKRWFDFITWDSLKDAKAASEQIMANPDALNIFALMDEESMMFGHYQSLGGVTKDV